MKQKKYRPSNSPFFRMSKIHPLGRLLGISPSILRSVRELERQYLIKEVESKGKSRTTQTPIRMLRRVHDRILNLLSRVETPDYLHSGVKGRSYVTNAHAHVGPFQTFTLDIRRFFPSVKKSKIYLVFRDQFQCAPDISEILARLLSHEGHLATGSPVSTILSFFCFRGLFDRLNTLSTQYGVIMTLYVDDIAFSAPVIPKEFRHRVRQEILAAGLEFHKEKFYAHPYGREITGVIVNLEDIEVPRRRHLASYNTAKLLYFELDPEERVSLFRSLTSRYSEGAQIDERFVARKEALKAAKGKIVFE